MRHITKVLLRTLIGFFVFAFGWIIITLFVWSYYPYEVADVSEPIEVLNENHQVAPGELIVLKLLVSKTSDYTPTVTRGVLCPNGSYYAVIAVDNATALPVGNFERIRSFELDPLTPTGQTKCRFVFRNEYQVNPIRTIVKTWVSEDISIVKGD